MHADQQVVLDDPLPERVELGQCERPGTAESGNRRRAHQDATRTALDRPLQLLDRLLDDRQGDDRGGENAVLIVEAPDLIEPLIQRMDQDVDGDRVVAQPLLEQAGQRREHQGAVQAQLVHLLQAWARLEKRRDRAHRLTEQLALALAVRVAELEVLLPGARAGDDLEGRVGNVVADLAADRDLGAPVDLHVLDVVLVLLGQVLGQRLRRLVEVIVRVEEGERNVFPMRQLTHEILLRNL